MKFTALTILALVAAVYTAPTSISDNNIGDIITVGIKANVSLQNEVNQSIVNVLLAYLNQQAIVLAPGQIPEFPERPEIPVPPTPFNGQDAAAALAKLLQ